MKEIGEYEQMACISAVVPVFNSENTLQELYNRVTKSLIEHCSDYEIIFINDASGDNSSKAMHSIAENDSNVKCIDLNKNFGQHNALLCGIR